MSEWNPIVQDKGWKDTERRIVTDSLFSDWNCCLVFWNCTVMHSCLRTHIGSSIIHLYFCQIWCCHLQICKISYHEMIFCVQLVQNRAFKPVPSPVYRWASTCQTLSWTLMQFPELWRHYLSLSKIKFVLLQQTTIWIVLNIVKKKLPSNLLCKTKILILLPCSFRWNLAYTAAYANLLWEKNTIRSLKSTVEVVLQNSH